MRGLFEIVDAVDCEPMTATTFRRWLEAPPDPLQTWLLAHLLCAVTLPDAVVLEPLGEREGGVVARRGKCFTCGVDEELLTGCCRDRAGAGVEWFGALVSKAVAAHPMLCLPAREGRYRAIVRVLESRLTECELRGWPAP